GQMKTPIRPLRNAGLRIRQALAAASLTLVFCHTPPKGAGTNDSGTVILNPPDSGRTGHHDAGPDAGDSGGITTFTPDARLLVTRLSPAGGPNAGGTPVTIIGGGFMSGAVPTDGGGSAAAAVTRVTFGGNPALNVLVLSDTELQVSSPPSTNVGPSDVVVAN